MRAQEAIGWPEKTATSGNLKGQAAIEYLMTYGWAILALVIVIGVLISTGALSPNYLITEECTLSTNFPCLGAVTTTSSGSNIALRISNGFAYKVKITKVQIYDRANAQKQITIATPEEIESGAEKIFSGKFIETIPMNSIGKFGMNVTYESCAPELADATGCSGSPHTVVGVLTAKVIQG